MATSENKLLVAAIDFGTTYSGYGFAYCDKPDAILMSKDWGSNFGVQAYKTPTSLLVDNAGKFKAFGHEAEHRYGQSVTEEEKDDNETEGVDGKDSAEEMVADIHLFKHFKMELHNMQKFDQTKKLKATDGYELPAVDVFGLSLKFLKDHLLEAVNNENQYKINASDVCWVLTVPAIWNEMAKSFMKEAAFKGGLWESQAVENRIIALEPESASLFCRKKDISFFVEDNSVKKQNLQEGDTYMIIDAGGGTMDITVHKLKTQDLVMEIQKPSGGPWGGIYVDKQLHRFLVELFGEDFLSAFMKKYPNQWLTMMIDWEGLKRVIGPLNKRKTVNLTISMVFAQMFTEVTGVDFKTTIKNKKSSGVSFKDGTLRIQKELVVAFFDTVIEPTIAHLKNLLQQKQVEDIKCIFLVGGFGESSYLQHRIKEEFQTQNRPVLIPNDASLCVIKGAVLFGHNPKTIASRISRQTICFKTTVKYDPNLHRKEWILDTYLPDKKVYVLKSMVTMNEDVDDDFEKIIDTQPVSEEAKTIRFDIYAAEKEEVLDPQDSDVKLMGSVVIPVDKKLSKIENMVRLKMKFGGPSFSFTATHKSTGAETAEKLQFPQ